jgi:uncharacterized protein with GYD domain
MPLYMYQAAYTAESLAAQLKKPENRVEAVGRSACEAVGGKLVGGWYCFGDYDLAIIADVPNNESMAAIALAIAAGGAVKSAKTTVLMTGSEAVAAMKKAEAVAKRLQARPIGKPGVRLFGPWAMELQGPLYNLTWSRRP